MTSLKKIYELMATPNEGLYKMDWMHSPLSAEPPCPYWRGMSPPHKGRPAQPEYRYYYLFFKTEEDARIAAQVLNLSYDHPDYRIYKIKENI